MQCITSPALDDTQIVSYIEGEADDEIVAHIKKCPYCADRANRLTLFQNRLRTRFYRSTCPSSMELGDYYLGLLSPSRELVVAQHVRECPLCSRDVAELQEYLTEPDPRPGMLEPAKVLIARLAGGPSGQPAYSALRGESKGPLVFEADGVVITLDIQPRPNGQISILGQVAAEDQDQWTGAEAQLIQPDISELRSTLDDLGAFSFEDVRPGSAQLKITSPNGVEVQVPNIEIAT